MNYKKKFTVVLPESLTDVLGIDEETVLETFFEDGKIKIRIIDDDGIMKSKWKANASITIGNHFAVHGIKVYDGGEKGLQVLYPGHRGTDNKFYDDFHPVTKEARDVLNGYVLDAYEQKIEQTRAASHSEEENPEEDEEPAFEQTM